MTSLPNPLWTPGAAEIDGARLTAFRHWLSQHRGVTFDSYHALWRWSVDDLAGFWDAVATFFDVHFEHGSDVVLGRRAMPGAEWFPGAELNYAGHMSSVAGSEPAMIAVREDGTSEEWSRVRLGAEVAGFAAHLRDQGVGVGDCVVAVLPNTPEAVVAFLATASLGATWAVCGPEFGLDSIVARLAPLTPAVLVTSVGRPYAGKVRDHVPVLNGLRDRLPSLRDVVVVGDEPGTTPWAQAVATPAGAAPEITYVPFDHPLWVLFSSGTTGAPKGIVHSHGGVLLEHLKFLGFHVDLHVGDRFFWHTSTSWMMWTIMVSALGTGATIVLYDGSPTYPALDRQWQIVADHEVSVFGTSAAYLHSCAKADLKPAGALELKALRALHSTGSPLSNDGFEWAHRRVGSHVPVFSGSGGTDVATAFVAGNPLLAVRSGEIPGPCLGVDVASWDDRGEPVVGTVGELVVTSPMPSMPVAFWGDPDGSRYRSAYFATYPGVWRHGDWIEFTEYGGAVIHGRSDATLNRDGIRIGTAEIYQAVEALPEIHEALVVGVESQGESSYRMTMFVVIAPGHTLDEALRQRVENTIRVSASPHHVPDQIIVVPGIPHTLTGKKLEVPVKRILMGLDGAVDRDAIDHPELLDHFAEFS